MVQVTTLKGTAKKFADATPEGEQLLGSPTSLWKTAFRRLLRRKTGVVGLILVGFMVFLAAAAPVLAPYDPMEVLIGKEPIRKREAPCVHLFGCDQAKPQHILLYPVTVG